MRNFEVIIIGARVAGSSLAIRLVRMGKKVLVVDKAEFPSDAISTHFMNPRGMTYLKDLGVLDDLDPALPRSNVLNVDINGTALGGGVDAEKLRQKLITVHDRDFDVCTDFACIRRTHLDELLIKKAKELGVEYLTGFSLSALDEANNTVLLRSFDGAELKLSADLIVGADGRLSKTAQLLKLDYREFREVNTFAVYTYVKGLKPTHRLAKKNRMAMGVAATNDNETMLLVYGPSSFYEAFSKNKDENFLKAIDYIDPYFANELKDLTQGRKLVFRTAVNMPGFIRKNSKTIPLIGDAACFKDQATASGMMHALRDSTLLADYLDKYYKGFVTQAEALEAFESTRYRDTIKYFDFSCLQAEMNPPKAEDLELYARMNQDKELRSQFINLYTDIIELKDFQKSASKLIDYSQARTFVDNDIETKYENIFDSKPTDLKVFTRSTLDFAQLAETNFEDRARHYGNFVERRDQTNTFQYERTLLGRPSNHTELIDRSGRTLSGLNFASQDYLALAQSDTIRDAALKALKDFGPHSAGSPMVIGNTKISRDLEDEIRKLTGKKHVLLFPTGYAAGMGAVLGMVRSHDYIVMDRLTHACLQQGAYAATQKVHRFSHLDLNSARYVLQGIRMKDARGGILLITEGVFSMDADSPDLRAFQELSDEFNATLLVDVAHDLGAMGPMGQGALGAQGFYGKADMVMGSFSKTFATNGGFVASDSEALVTYMKMYSTPFMFSNALSPLSSAVALEAAKIVQSKEGDLRREKLFVAVNTLRSELQLHSHKVLGVPSAIVPVLIGTESQARRAHKLSSEMNIAAMILEYPVVPLGATRYRLQVMASHTVEDAKKAARIIDFVLTRLKSRSDLSGLSRAVSTDTRHAAGARYSVA